MSSQWQMHPGKSESDANTQSLGFGVSVQSVMTCSSGDLCMVLAIAKPLYMLVSEQVCFCAFVAAGGAGEQRDQLTLLCWTCGTGQSSARLEQSQSHRS